MKFLILSLVLLLSVTITSLHGMITITVMQQASDVVITASGTADIDDLGFPLDAMYFSFVEPQLNSAIVGPSGIQHMGDAYNGLTTTEPAGSTGLTLADSGSGDAFGFGGSQLVVPDGYTSGTNLSGSGIYQNTTIADLGITAQEWTWGSGLDADSAILIIVPEPSDWVVFAGVVALGVVVWRRRKL